MFYPIFSRPGAKQHMSDRSTEGKQNLFAYLQSLHARGLNPADYEDEVWARYGQTVAVLVLDCTGFSRVSAAHGIVHFMSRLVQMRDIVNDVFNTEGALRGRFEADNAFAVFSHPDAALRAARACHGEVASRALMLTDDEPFQVCIGVGYGRMLYSETLEGFFSAEMNLASKLGEDTADGGETLITQNAFSSASAPMVAGATPAELQIAGLTARYYSLLHGPGA